jgi:ABC-2 type transport system permease protein
MTTSIQAPALVPLPVGGRPAADTLAGTGTMARFVVRRNRIRLLVWWLVIVGLFAYVEVYYTDIFTTQKALDDFATISNVPSIKALTGLAAAPNTMGGAVWTKIWMTCALMLAFGVAFLITRNGRADEETGRTELLRSRVLGLHAYSLASWLVTAALCVAVGVGVALVSIAGGLDPEGSGVTGSLILGASITGIGLVAIGVAALSGQLTSTSRAANGLAAGVLGAFYLLRMIGDLGDGRLTWGSPIGWGQQMQPWGANRWWPLGLMLVVTALLLGAAALLESRRDLGSGLLPERAGRPSAPARYARPLGLALRLQRGPIIGWTLTLLLAALMFGSVIDAMNTMMADASGTVVALMRGTGVSALLSLLVTMIAMITTIFAIQTTLSMRGDEASGIIEPQLAGAVSRTNWALQRLLIPAVGSALLLLVGGGLMGLSYNATAGQGDQSGALALAALAYWPAVMIFVAIAVALFGWLPRLAVALSWGVLAAMWVVVIVGDALHLPTWLLDMLPFSATPYQPMEPMSWTPVLVMTAVAVLLCWLGLARFARRDIQPG